MGIVNYIFVDLQIEFDFEMIDLMNFDCVFVGQLDNVFNVVFEWVLNQGNMIV